jgi:4-amino-4-deoxy-L-arabinose transferase-like glycosyltransferase
MRNTRRVAPVVLTAACLLFAALGLVVIPLAGIEDDEVLFAHPLFSGTAGPFSLAVFRHHLPLMVFAYSGALKTYLFWPVFHLFTPNPYSLRVPMVFAGILTILGFYYFAKGIAGIYAALLAAVLLASDPSFLLANTFDWGPVALQHLLLVAGCCLIVRGSLRSGFFVFGLALWDKAVFVWPLAGLSAGALVAYFPEIRRVFEDKRKVAGALVALLAGASPLILYNLRSRGETATSTAHFSLEHLPIKVHELNLALNGSGLFGFLAGRESEGNPKPAISTEARFTGWVHDLSGDSHSNIFPVAVVIAGLGAPLWWRSPNRRPALFAIVFSLITFAFMGITRDAGEAVHHTILLWPMPHLLVGIAIASLRPRWVTAVLGAVLVCSNVLVLNQYIFQLDRYGAHGNFTDAIYPLAEDLQGAQPEHVYVMDWGLTETLTFLGRGKLSLVAGADPFFTATPDPQQLLFVARMFDDPQGLFVGHIREREVFTGVDERFLSAATSSGYRKEIVRTVSDSNSRPVFEIYRLRKAPS